MLNVIKIVSCDDIFEAYLDPIFIKKKPVIVAENNAKQLYSSKT